MARLPGGSLQAPFVCPEVQEAKITETKINEARENYRPAAARASLLYFILNDLNKINPIYQFSLKVSHPGHEARGPSRQATPRSGSTQDGRNQRVVLWEWVFPPYLSPTAPQSELTRSCRGPQPQLQNQLTLAVLQAFNVVFEKAIQKTPPAEEVRQRVINLTDEITYSVYMYTARGLFERDKLIFLAQVTFQVTHDAFVPRLQPVHPRWQPPGLCRGRRLHSTPPRRVW